MTLHQRRSGRTWITDQLFARAKTAIHAVRWYEPSAATDTSEVEVTARGKIFSRAIANSELEADECRRALEPFITALIREIDTAP